MDEVLEMLDRTAKRIQKALDESKTKAANKTTSYDKILESSEASEAQKAKALIGKTFELDRLERFSQKTSKPCSCDPPAGSRVVRQCSLAID